MKHTVFVGLVLLLSAACARLGRQPSTVAQPAWDAVPLAPTLQFTESIGAGDVVLVILDAHTGAPLRNAVVSFDSTSRISGADTLGRIRFRRVSPGPQRLLVRCPGYYLQRDTITMPSAAGLALLIQMRRRPEPLGDDFEEIPVRKPPNDR